MSVKVKLDSIVVDTLSTGVYDMIKLLTEHRVHALFALATEITSVERCDGGGGREEKLQIDTVCTGQIKSHTGCVQGEGGAEKVKNAERVLKRESTG